MCTGFFEKNRTNAGKVTVIFEDILDEDFWFLITHGISEKNNFTRGFQIFYITLGIFEKIF